MQKKNLVVPVLLSFFLGGLVPATAAAGETGVAECDAYITQMTACLGKISPEMKDAMEQGLNASKASWKALAATPQGKESLKSTCKAVTDALKSNPMCK